MPQCESPLTESRITKALKEHKTAVLCSIVASLLFVYFLEPILGTIANLALAGAGFLGQAYVDRIYAQSAHLHSRNFAFLIVLCFLLAPACGLSIGFSIKAIQQLRGKHPREASTSAVAEFLSSDSKIAASTKLALGLASAIWILAIVGANYYQLTVMSSFQRHLRIVAPYIDSDAEERFVSDWSRMTTETEYRSIYARLEQIATSNDIQLPRNAIYSPFSL